MLNGVEVLNTVKVITYDHGYLVMLGVCIAFLVMAIIIFYVTFGEFKFVKNPFVYLILAMSLLSVLMYIASDFKEITQYQVTVSSEVKMKEFNEKYEIVEVNGEIYTIVEKDGA